MTSGYGIPDLRDAETRGEWAWQLAQTMVPPEALEAVETELRALRESHAKLMAALVTCERKLEEEAPLTIGVAWALDKAKAALKNGGAFSGRADLKTKDRCARCGHFTDTKDGICGPCVLVEKAEAL